MGVLGAPARRPAVFSLDRHVDLRGLVIRQGVSQELERIRRSSIIELRGGAGWGKTAAALVYAAERHRSGTQVTILETDGKVRICPTSDDADILYVVDDSMLTAEAVRRLVSQVQDDSRVQIVVCSRERHPLIERAHSQGLVARGLRLTDFRLTAAELLDVGRSRGVHLDIQRAEYVVHAAGGWPAVATGFVDRYAEGARDSSLAAIDRLVTRSFEMVLSELLGESALALLARASLSDGIRRNTVDGRTETDALGILIERVRRLGLGEWVAA